MSSVTTLIYQISEKILFIPFVFLLLGSIYLSFKTRFIQIRMIPSMLRQFFKNKSLKSKNKDPYTIQANKALFTAMATSIGIGAIMAPIVAIGFGGPGALLGFILAAFFGGASMYTEVSLAVQHRKRLPNGQIIGGPMQYIKDNINSKTAKIYAFLCFLLLTAWESNQSNALASLFESYHIPTVVSGIVIALLILVCLLGGIKRVGNVSQKLVPLMFVLYASTTLWILICNAAKLPGVFKLILFSAFSTKALSGAAIGTGFFKAMRWGLAKAFFSNEAGLGTATIPHSMSKTQSAEQQAILSMVSVYANSMLCILTGLVVLVTGIWQEPGITFNITILTKALAIYFPTIGPILLLVCTTLFGITTLLGNGYNGSQCYLYATKNRSLFFYYAIIAIVIFAGAIADLKLIWALTDFFIVPVALINIVSLITIVNQSQKTKV